VKTPPQSTQELREAYQRSLRLRDVPDRTSCPDPEAILAVVEGRSPEDARLETLDHAMQCLGCRRELDLLRALRGATPSEGTRRAPWLAAAASVVLLLGVGYGLSRMGEDGGPVMRGAESALELLAPGEQAVPPGDIHFIWSSLPGAFEYVIEIMDGEGRTLLTRALPDTALVLDAEQLPSWNGLLLWWVRARLQDGNERASETRALEISGR
jgi:hypothetical protein